MPSTQPTSPALPANLSIPSLPAVVQKIEKLLQNPNSGVREMAAVIAEDAPLAAKVLKIANSSYYGLRERCLSTQHAAAVLGVRVLRNVVTQASVIRQYSHLSGRGFDLDELWKHSVLTAQATAFLAKRCRGSQVLTPDELYACGLLHDLGKVVMFDALGERYSKIVAQSQDNPRGLHVLERRELGYDHTDVGFRIAMAWGLPQAVQSAIQFHHGPAEHFERDAVIGLVAGVNLLVHDVSEGRMVGDGAGFSAYTRKSLAIKDADLDALAEFVRGALDAVET